MLKAKNMPKEFWAEAVCCAVYLSNRSPTVSVRDQTPQEAWNGKKPSVKHLRVFGSIAYAQVPQQERSKLDDRSAKYVFIGYDYQSKGYRLFNPMNNKVVVSRDVQFDKEDAWKWEDQQENTYSFLPYFDDEDDVAPIEEPEPSTPQGEPPTPQSENSSERPRRMRSLEDIYEDTEEINDELHCLFVDCESLSFQEAVQDKKWRAAMDEEIKSIEKNNTWELTSLPNGHESIGVKWVYKFKKNAKGEIEKYKARLVVKGYKQKHGVDYDEVFAPVARMETIRLIISLAAQEKWKIYQMDVKTVFLNGFIEKYIYVEEPLGYEVEGHEEKVLKLKKSLYGLKQAPRAWNSHINKYFQDNGFVHFLNEYALYSKVDANGDMMFVCIYVDDLIFTGNNPVVFDEFKRNMFAEFEMTDLGLMSFFLGLEVKQTDWALFL